VDPDLLDTDPTESSMKLEIFCRKFIINASDKRIPELAGSKSLVIP
jgi:hypothetical protein